MNVDTIHVLKDGRVVEEGSHYKLISDENSVYSDMWRNYLRESEEAQEEVEVLTTPSEKV